MSFAFDTAGGFHRSPDALSPASGLRLLWPAAGWAAGVLWSLLLSFLLSGAGALGLEGRA